jgi:hypothetical protein
MHLANHDSPQDYWQGGNFELNISFEYLSSEQWRLVLDALWADVHLNGPYETRYIPHRPAPPEIAINYPEPTTTLIQHASLTLDDAQFGVDVLVTRSLFEGISLLTPVNMFAGLQKGDKSAKPYPLALNPARALVEEFYQALAVRLFGVVPFVIASMGWNRECQLLSELLLDKKLKRAFFAQGNALMTEQALRKAKRRLSEYEQIAPNLRWIPPKP